MHLQAEVGLLALLAAQAAGQTGTWAAAYSRAQTALAKLSLSDKAGIVTGVGWNNGKCVGNTHAASAIGFPSLCLQDGPLGVRYATSATAFTPGIQAASTWDLDLMRQRGQYLGAEAKALGVHVQLGPVAGPLGKIAQGGRNWEGFSPDPYLAGLAMAATIEGMQSSGVQATAKHFVLNEQELNRETISSNADDRTVHELYAWPFADAVHSNVAAVMCSYNKVNGDWACESDYVMNTLLKKEMGFPGYVMTDWNAQHSTANSANRGLDMTMPGTDYNGGSIYWGPQLQSAVQGGSVAQSRVDDMVTRVLAAWYLLGQDSSYPSVDLSRNVQGSHNTNVRAVARDGIVLLKNDGAVLPFKKPASIAVIGTGAFKGNHAANGCQDKACDDGALGMGWGSGAVNYPYFVAPYDAMAQKAAATGTTIKQSNSDGGSQGAAAAQGADVAVVFLTADSGEGYLSTEGVAGDRNNLDPWHSGNALVQAVAGASKNVVVVIHSVGPLVLESILANPSVKAIVWAGLPSQESGNALVDVLWGDVSPSGKLPYTIAKSASDYGTAVVSGGSDAFPEGLYVDYRHFDKAAVQPRYEFGFGLSYANFTYSALSVTSTVTSGPAVGSTVPGGPADLWDTVATVTATVTNTGAVAAKEVAQLYVAYPSSAGAAPLQLRGFSKLSLAAGAAGTATFNVRRRDLSVWDAAAKQWVVPAGVFGVSVGASSRDLRLKGSITPGGGGGVTPPSSSSSSRPPVGTTTTTTTTSTRPASSAPSSSASRTTTTTTTTRTSSATGQPTGGNCAAKYGQCGGNGWTGATCCVSGSTCKYSNDYYSQCL